ncbi:MAG: septal ring lytic transglycosylase RlpA family protein [Alphaproteobacteria bacterium]|nr:MAG: septal ring lytic transglycosylase RlpA family protein [Alphaproteobacteria bacterium]
MSVSSITPGNPGLAAMNRLRGGLVRHARAVLTASLLLTLTACDTPGGVGGSGGAGRGAWRVGEPYQINGMWYTPREDYTYDQTGVASWYGPGFNGRMTANGEIYDENEITAAHPTLPMPSLVRVTNLGNSRSVVVRINDRGPFKEGRMIDLSRRGAQLLGFEQSGTARVRVQIMAQESRAIADAARKAGSAQPDGPMVAAAPRTAVQSQVLAPPPPSAGAMVARSVPAAVVAPPSVPVVSDIPSVSADDLDLPEAPLAASPARVLKLPSKPRSMTTAAQPAPKASASKDGYFIQAGSFSDSGNANRFGQRLGHMGAVDVARTQVGGRTFYRVRLGPFSSMNQAQSLLPRVKAAGGDGARIVTD